MSYLDQPSDSKVSYLMLGIIFLLIMMAVGLIANQPEPTVELTVKDWRCISSHVEDDPTGVYIPDGIYFEIPGKKNVCDHWIRRLSPNK